MSAKCPEYESDNIVRNGKINNGKQRFLCKKCGRNLSKILTCSGLPILM
ncbi:hypothetical protein GMMP15_660008 [Candidatus Magnetomoraceae bacterium gMMP-15]